jgi:hypothetical protein
MAVGISHQFLCKGDRADRVQAPIDDASIDSGVATFYRASGSPMTNIYDRENITEPAIEAIAGAVPNLVCSIEAPKCAGRPARE